MTHHAGLDVSIKETAIWVIDAVGAVVCQGKVRTQIDAIAQALARHAPELKRAVMETGPVADGRCFRHAQNRLIGATLLPKS